MTSAVSRKAPQRILSPAEKEQALEVAHLKGLPQDWDVEWDNKRHKKIWVSPNGSRRCYSLPQALRYAVKNGQVLSTVQIVSKENDDDRKNDGQKTTTSQPTLLQHHRKLSSHEVAEKVQEGRSRGLPEGWTMVWDNMSGQRVWISPDGKKKCKGIPQALRYSLSQGWIATLPMEEKQSTIRVLSQEEVQTFLKDAREMGLPNGWKVEWNNAKNKRRWIAPDGCKVHSIPEALRMSLRKGWVSKLPNPKTSNTSRWSTQNGDSQMGEGGDNRGDDAHSSKNQHHSRTQQHAHAFCNPSPRRRRTKHILSDKRQLTESEQLASIEEAEARGLKGGWKAEFSNQLNRRVWISPENGKRYRTIADALARIPMPERKDSQKENLGTTAAAQATTKEMSIPRKATRRKRKVDANEAERTVPSLDFSESASLEQRRIPKKKRRKDSHETNKAPLSLLPHAKTRCHVKDDSNYGYGPSDGENREHNHDVPAITSGNLSFAGNEIVVERDSEGGCVVTI